MLLDRPVCHILAQLSIVAIVRIKMHHFSCDLTIVYVGFFVILRILSLLLFHDPIEEIIHPIRMIVIRLYFFFFLFQTFLFIDAFQFGILILQPFVVTFFRESDLFQAFFFCLFGRGKCFFVCVRIEGLLVSVVPVQLSLSHVSRWQLFVEVRENPHRTKV